ncbi:MAG: ATP-dependent sacrificial sulfur transferase LarE, partial [bacterium]
MQNKLRQIREILQKMEGVLIAYSGGVDSTLLLYLASCYCNTILAVIASSPLYPTKELDYAKINAEKFGVDYIIIETNELNNPKFVENPKDRCYFCKYELFSRLKDIAKEKGISYILDGENLDDTNDFRPGAKAGKELGIRSPLKEVGFTKQEIRSLSKKLGLPTWNKPSFACLASRFPYKEKIGKEKLERVAKAEDLLISFGFKQVRVRAHHQIARIELESKEIKKALKLKDEIVRGLKEFGFT